MAGSVTLHFQTGTGDHEVVIVEGISGRTKLSGYLERGDDVFFAGATGTDQTGGVLLERARKMHVRGVGEDHGVSPLFMLEEIEDAFLFEQARHKVEIGFSVLHTELSFLIADAQLELVAGKAMIREDTFYYLWGGQVLEDPYVGAFAQTPEPWDHRAAKCGESYILAFIVCGPSLRKGRDDAIQVSSVAVGKSDRDSHVSSQQ